MGLEQNNEQHYREVVDKFHDPNASYQMSTRDYVLRPSADEISGPIFITLPPVADAKGRFYSIIARDADNANIIVIRDKDDSECWMQDIALTNKCQRVLLYSDGLAWHPLGNGVGNWPGAATTIPDATAAPTTVARQTTLTPTTLTPTTLDSTTLAPTTLA